jgi:hypothetical protein
MGLSNQTVLMEYGSVKRELGGPCPWAHPAMGAFQSALNSDFATVAVAGTATWTAWVEYANDKNAVMARRRSGGTGRH